MIQPRLALAFAVALAGGPSVACGPSQSTEDSTADTEPDVLEVEVGPATTRGELARQNLSAQIDGMRHALELDPSRVDASLALVEALVARGQFFGTWNDFDEALSHSSALMLSDPSDPLAVRARVGALAAVHRFAEAQTLLDATPSRPEFEGLRLSLATAVGSEPDATLETLGRRAELHPDTETLAAWAGALATAGRFEEADAAYRRAAEAHADVAPFPLARIAFARGVMWSERAGHPELGRPLYREALRRLPDYVVARVHLAELESRDDPAAGLRVLAELANDVVDPEPLALRGQLRDSASDLARASAAYHALLERMPEAVWDHAAEFFGDAGADPELALELARLNLRARNTERALLIALRAADAADDAKVIDELLDAVPDPIHTVPLAELVAELR